MYHTPFETMIRLSNVLVAISAAPAQSEIQQHVFSRILLPNSDCYFSGTACNPTHLYLLLIFIFIWSSSRVSLMPLII